jgi:hypothetical protein
MGVEEAVLGNSANALQDAWLARVDEVPGTNEAITTARTASVVR